jgi:hypothetical protein
LKQVEARYSGLHAAKPDIFTGRDLEGFDVFGFDFDVDVND